MLRDRQSEWILGSTAKDQGQALPGAALLVQLWYGGRMDDGIQGTWSSWISADLTFSMSAIQALSAGLYLLGQESLSHSLLLSSVLPRH